MTATILRTAVLAVLALLGCGRAPRASVAPASAPAVTAGQLASIEVAEPTAGDPVMVGAALLPGEVAAGGEAILVVRVRLAPSWHIYALQAGSGPELPTRLDLDLPEGVEAAGEWIVPEAHAVPGTEARGWEREVIFQRPLRVGPDVASGATLPIRCTVAYQACDPFRCLPPASKTANAPLRVVPAAR